MNPTNTILYPQLLLRFVKTNGIWNVITLHGYEQSNLKEIFTNIDPKSVPQSRIITSPISDKVLSTYLDKSGEVKIAISLQTFTGAIVLTKVVTNNTITYPYNKVCDDIVACLISPAVLFAPSITGDPIYTDQIYVTKL